MIRRNPRIAMRDLSQLSGQEAETAAKHRRRAAHGRRSERADRLDSRPL